MSLYVIARKSEDFLDSPVFHAGPDDEQEVIAVFTKPGLAEAYIEDAGWKTATAQTQSKRGNSRHQEPELRSAQQTPRRLLSAAVSVRSSAMITMKLGGVAACE